MATDMAALLLLYFSLAVVQAGPRVCGVRGHQTGPPLTLPSSSFYDSTFSRSRTRTWQAHSLPAQAGADGSPALLARPSSPRLSRGHRAHALLTAGGRGALLLCGTAGSKSGSEIPPESG